MLVVGIVFVRVLNSVVHRECFGGCPWNRVYRVFAFRFLSGSVRLDFVRIAVI